jgi:flavin-dependent dehydrogenase
MYYLEDGIPDELIEREIRSARIRFGTISQDAHDHEPIGRIVDRGRFDRYLLELAEARGAEVRFLRVGGVEDTGEEVRLQTPRGVVRSRYAVIAEGAFGGLKTTVRAKDRPRDMGLCAVTRVPATEDRIQGFSASTIEVEFGLAGFGYGWIFPHGDHFSVGIGGVADKLAAPRRVLADYLSAGGFDPALAGDAELHPIPAGGIRRRMARGRVLLAGDAAGLVDAFLGEGISYAIRSGQNAARAVAAGVGEPGVEPAGRYDELCEADFGRHMRDALRLARLLHTFPGLVLGGFVADPELIGAFTDVPAMRRTYGSYIRRALRASPRILARGLRTKLRRPSILG